jgi:hypothetical protein
MNGGLLSSRTLSRNPWKKIVVVKPFTFEPWCSEFFGIGSETCLGAVVGP